jgi:hypothetical protein
MADISARAQTGSSIRLSIGWGQLFAGTIVNGFSVWHLYLKATHVTTSKLVAGLDSLYLSIRDFLMLPMSFANFNLTSDEKDYLTMSLILSASLIRAYYKAGWSLQLRLCIWLAMVGLSTYYAVAHTRSLDALHVGVRDWIYVLFTTLINIVLLPLVFDIVLPLLLYVPLIIIRKGRTNLREYLANMSEGGWAGLVVNVSTLLNIVATLGWGATLLLLNSASS